MDQALLLNHLLDVVESQLLPYAIAGSHASMAYGETRLTNDIDVVVGLTRETLAPFCRAFPFPEFYVSEDGARSAVAGGGMFNIIHPEAGLKIDVIVPKSDFDRHQLARVIRLPAVGGRPAAFSAPEDVILKKMQAYDEGGSEKHLRDIAGMLKIMGGRIDRDYINEWAKELDVGEIWNDIQLRQGPRGPG